MSEQEKKWTLDALAALSNAISDSKHIMKSSPIAGLDVLEMLISKGFTITRQPAMTDAELEREARKLCTVQNIYWDKSQPTTHYMTEAAAIALAKRCRG